MVDDEAALSIEDLARAVEVPVRTIRYYIARGLLPKPRGRGRATVYGEEHRLRLQLIHLLTKQRVPLEKIDERLAPLGVPELRALLAEEEQGSAALKRAEDASPKEYVSALLKRARERATFSQADPATAFLRPVGAGESSGLSPAGHERSTLGTSDVASRTDDTTWRRLELAPGIELHVRSDAEVRHAHLIDRLLRVASRLSPRDRYGSGNWPERKEETWDRK